MKSSAPTTEFISPDKYYALRRLFICALLMAVAFGLIGFGIGRFASSVSPGPITQKSLPAKKESDLSPTEKEQEARATAKATTQEMAVTMAQEKIKKNMDSVIGILEVRDYKAITTKSKRAAISISKGEGDSKFGTRKDLAEGVFYTVHGYRVVHSKELNMDIGIGIITDHNELSCHLIWYPGNFGGAKAPLIVTRLIVTSGINLEISGSK